ncbi:unnamed protein product [Adineta ricciae]|uniref:Uncharacterized protein n=1 Tax=Adineta ricciae TaxID=249248 RepID=A0A816HCY2_ADIRI|nr:unnamed protein product [Adineta ricciae]
MLRSLSLVKVNRIIRYESPTKYFESSTQSSSFSPESSANPIPQQLPLIVSRQLEYPHTRYPPLQAWLETLGQKRDDKLGIVDLHPSIWQTSPRYLSIHFQIVSDQ